MTSNRFYTHQEALLSLRHISSTKLDERLIRCDLDPGYTEGRQYGRGRSGGQVRDEYRQEYDAGRGGWGAGRLREEEERKRMEEAKRKQEQEELYRNAEIEGQQFEGRQGGATIPGGADAEYYDEERGQREADLSMVSASGMGGAFGKRGREDSEDVEDEEDGGKRRRERSLS